MNKINLYIFNQIVKSCTLVFFIFVSIAWLMQISRIFTMMNNLNIQFLDILSLSMWLIPNLINVTLPFIAIFGLVLAFIKFERDKEIIAIYSLGLSTSEIKKPIIFLLVLCIGISFLLNFILSPYSYDIYKKKEFELRNKIEFDKINISNFIELDNNLLIDFENNNQKFEDILINFINEDDNLIYAKSGTIINEDNKLVFTLFNGFKLAVNNEEIEKLKFENYRIEFPSIKKNVYKNFDKNTVGIYELLNYKKDSNKIIILQRITDILIILSFVLYFYIYIIKKNNYSHNNFFLFTIFTIFILITDNFLENINVSFSILIISNIFNILLIHILGASLKLIKFYE